MKNHFLNIILPVTILLISLPGSALKSDELQPGVYPAYDLKAERIRFVNDAVRITWNMDQAYAKEIIVGRSENEITKPEDVLKSLLIGTFYSYQEGIIIDRNIQQGKQYYYILITKEDLLKREIKLLPGVNCTLNPVPIFAEPGPVTSITAETIKDNSVEIEWDKARGSRLVYNIYRSKSIISSRADLEVAEKIASTDDDSFVDSNIPEYGTYFYAVTITDKNQVEYFTPVPDKNYTTKGIYIKGKTLTTPLNTGAFLGQNGSIIIKWEKGHSLTGKEISGYEIYRSEEMINSQLKLTFSRLLHIADASATLYTDSNPGNGKFYYAVFARYNDGTVDISFDSDSNYTKSPVIIASPYTITAMETEITGEKIIIKWSFTGNNGNETVIFFRTKKMPENSGVLMPDSAIGSGNIKTGTFTAEYTDSEKYYYGIYIKNDEMVTIFKPGINITPEPLGLDKKEEETGKEAVEQEKSDVSEKKEESCSADIDYIIKKYFYKERYRRAIKELNIFISGTDNEYERAKARLFIARSYIELGEYEKSIILLNMEDVRFFFTEEAQFWSDFAMARLK